MVRSKTTDGELYRKFDIRVGKYETKAYSDKLNIRFSGPSKEDVKNQIDAMWAKKEKIYNSMKAKLDNQTTTGRMIMLQEMNELMGN